MNVNHFYPKMHTAAQISTKRPALRYVVGYMVGNFVKRNFRPYNRWYTSPNEYFEYGYPHSNALFQIYSSKAQHFASNWSFVSNVKQLRQPITSDVTYDVGAPTVYRRIYWRKFLTLSNQTSRYIRKCIRMKSKCNCRRFFGANWKFRHSGNCSASLGKPRNWKFRHEGNCSASWGLLNDAEQLPSWRNCRVMQNSYRRDGIFNQHLTTIKDSYIQIRFS